MPWQPVKYCLSLLPHSEAELYGILPAVLDADLVEVRLDYLGKIDLTALRKNVSRRLIITLRTKEEGGFWKGTNRQRIAIFRDAIAAGVDYLDIEWRSVNQILPALKFAAPTELILSYHTGHHDPAVLQQRLQEMISVPAAVYKFIFTAADLKDCLTALSLIDFAAAKGVRYVIHAMGQDGQLSRILGALRGNQFTYVSLSGPQRTAEGQLDLYTARDCYFLHEKTAHSRVIGLLGYPIAQSHGWKLHNRLLHARRMEEGDAETDLIDFIYVNFPAADFDDFWEHWQDKIDGLSITIPHKEKMVSRLDYAAKSVEMTGVCNTAIRKDRKWWGFNTDYMAMFQLLNDWVWGGQDEFLVYGTGATARTALATVKEVSPAPFYISGRNIRAGEKLAARFGATFIPPEELDKYSFGAIIQTTPIGMYPNIEEMPPLQALLPRTGLVFDVVYNPAVTTFMLTAVEHGCRTISGENMYLAQARKQFELFSGREPGAYAIKRMWDDILAEKSQ